MNKSWKPEQSLGGLVFSLGNKFSKGGKRLMQKHGLTQMSYPRILVLNAIHETPLSQNEISIRLHQSKASITETLRRLEKQRYIKCLSDEKDGRKKIWVLTKAGKDMLLKAKEIVRESGRGMDRFLKKNKINEKEIEITKKVLGFLVQKDSE